MCDCPGFIKCQLHRHHTVFMKMKIRSQYQVIDENCKKCRRYLNLALSSSLSKSILVCFVPPETLSYYNNYMTKKLMNSLKMLTQVTTMPISLTIKVIRRWASLIIVAFATRVTGGVFQGSRDTFLQIELHKLSLR